MLVNADFGRRAAVHAAAMPWTSSPLPGVERKLLDRIGDEVARATSLVRFAPHSRFAPHVHGGGEEFLVLDGVFQDARGEFPAGTYVRNPPQSDHEPRSDEGCVIFVKLWQFDPADRVQVHVAVNEIPRVQVLGHPEICVQPLFRRLCEDVRLETWTAGAMIQRRPCGGIELLTLEGCFSEGGETFRCRSWLRLPPGAALRARVGPDGARVWVKEGHLAAPLPALGVSEAIERE